VRHFPLSIFSIGRDRELLRQRERIIAGRSELRVRSLSPEEAEAPARGTTPHLWIFCNSVELAKLVYLASSIRRYSAGSRLLRLKGSLQSSFEDSLFHWVLPASEGIEPFLKAVSTLAVAA
jgi:hypothetical protein